MKIRAYTEPDGNICIHVVDTAGEVAVVDLNHLLRTRLYRGGCIGNEKHKLRYANTIKYKFTQDNKDSGVV